MTETPGSPESTPAPRTTAAQKRAAAQAEAAQASTAQTQPAPVATTPKRNSSTVLVAAVVAAALVGGISGAGVSLLAVSLNQDKHVETSSAPSTVTVNDPDHATNATAVAVKAAASVVTINVKSDSEGGTGSGVVLSADGYILTNTHVVTLEGAAANPTVEVTTSDGHLYKAKIVGTDPIADLAVIKAEGVTDLVPAEFSDSSKLNVGDTAIAIGAPLGLTGTVTDGIVSSLNRSIQIASSAVPDDSSDSDNGDKGTSPDSPFNFWQFDVPGDGSGGDTSTAPTSSSATISLAVIQTDAAINPGNSGGALLDSDGKVIGINVAIASAGSSTGSGQSGSIGVGFAIPSNFAQRIAKEIIDNGKATHGLLGAAVLDVTEDTNVKNSATVGASIAEITDGGGADKAGLKVGDVITKFDGVPIGGKTDLTAQVRSLAAGSTATVTYVRDGKTAETKVTLGTLKV